MNLNQPSGVDFETMPIEGRPDYPPVPVGVSINEWGKKPKYFGWGHINGGNNCARADAVNALKTVWKGPLLFHNAKFDLSVATEHLELPMPSWDHVHDTLFQLYLDDPRASTFALKPAAERILGLAPGERDAVNDWLVGAQPIPGRRLTPSKAGAYVALAPGDLVGEYANGDLVRTNLLFKYGLKQLKSRSMLAAYDRERRLLPILLANERGGVRVDLDRLRADVKTYQAARDRLDAWLRKALKVNDINFNSADELGEALVRSGKADEALLGRTANGKLAVSQTALRAGVKDPQVYAALVYRSQLSTCLGTFMMPWLDVAERTGGFIHTNWNQVRSDRGGTTTGRMSSSPNFQNVPNEFEELFYSKAHPKLPKTPVLLPPLPFIKGYIIPDKKDHVLIDRDASQQEVRILGHFEGESLQQAYNQNPWMDAHDLAKAKLEDIGKIYERKQVKNTVFGLLYGQSAASLAVKNELSIEESRNLMNNIKNNIFPGLKAIYDDLRYRAKNDLPVRTWGGREYFCEEPKYSEKFGRWMTFDYKLLNLIIQGSAAEATKEAIIRWHEMKHEDDRFLLSVHDQQLGSVPAKRRDAAMAVLKEAMDGVTFDVPMLSEGKWSPTNWHELEPYDKKGVKLV